MGLHQLNVRVHNAITWMVTIKRSPRATWTINWVLALYGLLAHSELILCANTSTPLSLFHFKVIWKSQFGCTSQEHGTLGYFKSVLNCTPVEKDPKKNVDVCLDLLLCLVAHLNPSVDNGVSFASYKGHHFIFLNDRLIVPPLIQ